MVDTFGPIPGKPMCGCGRGDNDDPLNEPLHNALEELYGSLLNEPFPPEISDLVRQLEKDLESNSNKNNT
jgi:hypothetical protein